MYTVRETLCVKSIRDSHLETNMREVWTRFETSRAFISKMVWVEQGVCVITAMLALIIAKKLQKKKEKSIK